MIHFSVDIEATGPCPPLYSMISLGAVCIEDMSKDFYMQLEKLPGAKDDPNALEVAMKGWDDSLPLLTPEEGMNAFFDWVVDVADGQPVRFVSDNAGFDWGYVNYYFHAYVGKNPFGFSPASLTWLGKGLKKNMRYSFKKLRKTKHTHNALDDAMGNAQAWNTLVQEMR